MRFAFLLTGLAMLLPHVAVSARAQGAGTLDSSFGVGGTVITPISGFSDRANALVRQTDGKLVAAGACLTGGTDYDFCLARYHVDGTLDMTFGSGGVVTTAVSSGQDHANALVLQPDGKLVAAGECNNGTSFEFCLARYHANGSLDAAFGSNGTVIVPIGTSGSFARALVLQPDGKLVAAGSCRDAGTDGEFCLVRYHANGTIDAGFAAGGAAIVEFDDEDDAVWALVLLPDGKLVAAGVCGVFGEPHVEFCMARFNTDGELDPTFGVVARVTTDIAAESDRAFALVVQPDGRLVAAGTCDKGSTFDFCLARYEANGTLDATFGVGGKVITDVSGIDDHDGAHGLVAQPDGKVVAAGFCDGPVHIGFCLARYDVGGNLDSTFGAGGTVTTDINSGFDEGALALVFQPDGRLVAAGNCDGTASSNVCLARYTGDPAFAIQHLMTRIESDPDIPDNLASPLKQTIKLLSDDNAHNNAAVCGKIGAFINQVDAGERSRKLTAALADELRQGGEGPRLSLECR